MVFCSQGEVPRREAGVVLAGERGASGYQHAADRPPLVRCRFVQRCLPALVVSHVQNGRRRARYQVFDDLLVAISCGDVQRCLAACVD